MADRSYGTRITDSEQDSLDATCRRKMRSSADAGVSELQRLGVNLQFANLQWVRIDGSGMVCVRKEG